MTTWSHLAEKVVQQRFDDTFELVVYLLVAFLLQNGPTEIKIEIQIAKNSTKRS
jgi:hypothetical protein